jgi:hypothetical protein
MKTIIKYRMFSTSDYPASKLIAFANSLGAKTKPLEDEHFRVDLIGRVDHGSNLHMSYERAATELGLKLIVAYTETEVDKADLDESELLRWYPPSEEDEDMPGAQALVKASIGTLLIPFQKKKPNIVDLIVNKKIITKRNIINCNEVTLLISDKVKKEWEKAGLMGLQYWPTKDNNKKDKNFPESWGVTITNIVPELVSETEFLQPDKPYREIRREHLKAIGDFAIYDRKDDEPIQREFYVSSRAYKLLMKLKIKDTEWRPVTLKG